MDAAADTDDADPTGHLLAMLDAAIHAHESGGDPEAVHKIAALDDEEDDPDDTDPWDGADEK